MRESKTLTALDDNLIVSVLRHLHDHKFRATMACVCKTWRACVRRSWDRVHFCFDGVDTLMARFAWLESQLLESPLLLKSLELHSGVPDPTCFRSLTMSVSVCIVLDTLIHIRIPDVAHAGPGTWHLWDCVAPTPAGYGLERFSA